MKIFKLNLSHIPEIMAIENATHVTPWSEKIVMDSFSNRSHNYGLFCQQSGNDKLIAYYFTECIAGELSLENICVDKNLQGQGLAKQLMQHLTGLAKDIRAEEIWLEVRASNRVAVQLYSGFGFQKTGIRKDYYRIPNCNRKEDAILMKKVMV